VLKSFVAMKTSEPESVTAIRVSYSEKSTFHIAVMQAWSLKVKFKGAKLKDEKGC